VPEADRGCRLESRPSGEWGAEPMGTVLAAIPRRALAASDEAAKLKRVPVLRVCPGTSSRITKFSEHEAD
jgi:hypothetical protein